MINIENDEEIFKDILNSHRQIYLYLLVCSQNFIIKYRRHVHA